MPDDDVCGYEDTTTGHPCQHPAGSCPVPSHSGAVPDGGNPQGRPTSFTDEKAHAAIDAARIGKSEAGCERAAGVSHGTLANWKEKDPAFTDENGEERDFFSAFMRARDVGERRLIQDGMYDPDADSQMARFLLSTSFDYVKTERREHSGADGGPLNVLVEREEYVGE